MITTSNFPDLVSNSETKWKEGFKEVAMAMRQIFDAYSTEQYQSSHSTLDGFGLAKRKTETGVFEKGDPEQGYKINLQQARIGLVGEVTWEMRKFDRYRQIGQMMKKLGMATASRLELDLANFLSYGFDAASPYQYTNMDSENVAVVTGDNLPIFHGAHTITGGAATYSNKGTLAFDAEGAALTFAMNLFKNMLAPKGDRAHRSPDTILTSDDQNVVLAVSKLLNSTSVGGNNSGTANPYKGRFTHTVAPRLAENALGVYEAARAKQWYLVDSSAKDMMPCEVSEEPTFLPPSSDASLLNSGTTDAWEFRSTAAYDYGIVEASCIVGMDGTTT